MVAIRRHISRATVDWVCGRGQKVELMLQDQVLNGNAERWIKARVSNKR